MTASTERQKVFTPSRIVALALIGLAVLGLAYLRFTGPDRVSVPKGAHAGDLILERCTYATGNGGYRADCGTLVVPENRADPQSRLIALPVTRIRAKADHPAEPIFRLQGGPGITNMQFRDASRFADDHDVVLVGYRGMDGSVRLDCPEVESAMKRSTDLLADTSFRARADAFRTCADRLADDGVDLAGYTLPQRVDDLEAARRALGYGRIDLLSESAGTRTAMIYAWRYPTSIHRSVMIGVNPPGHFLWDAKTTGEQVRRYAALCAQDESCRSRTPDLAASLHSAFGHIPKRWWFLPIKKGNVQAAAFFGLMDATTDGAGPLAAPWTIDTLLSAQQGDGGGAWLLSTMAQVAFPSEQLWGDVAAVARADAAHARRFFATGADRGSVIGTPGTDLIWAGGRLLGAWPASPDENAYTKVRDSNVETLLIGGELDVATPPQWATRELLPHLPNGKEVLLENIGHTNDFWTYQPEAGTRLITTYLASGRVDRSLYTVTPVDFTPALSPGAIALIVLGSILGLAALAVLSLLWMAFRVHRRGAFGRKSSAVLRSVFPVVLGLGGWLLGVLIVITALPSVPLDDELLAMVSVGVPVGLGVYWAWVRPDRSGGSKGVGLAAAVAGAVVGARLGFHATADLAALATAIVGAVAGANLLLILLDMARAWSAADRRTATDDVRRPGIEPAAPVGRP
jgi:pimeloyl-ACP methyl ester carboxylesterase